MRIETDRTELHHSDEAGNRLFHQLLGVILPEQHCAVCVDHLEGHGDLNRFANDRSGDKVSNDLLTDRRRSARSIGVQLRDQNVHVRNDDQHGRSGCRRTGRIQHHLVGVKHLGINRSVRLRKLCSGVFELLPRQCEHDATA
jgi:hypothetical protein